MLPRVLTVSKALAVSLTLVACLASEARAAEEESPFTVEVDGKGPPMILIPGLANSGEVWDTTVAHFKDQYECHVLTLGGFAGAPKAEGPFLETMRAGIADYVRDKKLHKPIVVGHSLGGFMVYLLGSSEPDLFGPLVAVDGLPCAPAIFVEKITPKQLKEGEQLGTFIAAAPREQFLAQQRQMVSMWLTDKTQVERVMKWSEASDQATVGKALGEMWSTDLRDKAGSIKSPVLLVGALGQAAVGDERAKLRAGYEAQVEKIADHRVVFADEAKHFIMFDAPEWLWKEMKTFLAEQKAEDRQKE